MQIDYEEWKDAQKFETDWHALCTNSYGEEEKQLVYAHRMGLRMFHNGKSPYNIDMKSKSIIDIGGGPVSLLLKCVGLKLATVVDPLPVPEWVKARYAMAGIEYMQIPAEELHGPFVYDEAFVYNCLQHTRDPREVIASAQKVAKLIRIFEWVDTPTNIGHPHSLTAKDLDSWLGGEGRVEHIAESNCVGKCYYGVFPT